MTPDERVGAIFNEARRARAERDRARNQVDLVRAVLRRALGEYEGGDHGKLGSCLYTIEAILREES